ncbi:MAG TPA: glycosyltransferase [Flavisolibacter sp.]
MQAAIDISVLMCVYNGEAFIRSAVDSVLAQTLRSFELIIVNDGSTDRTREILAAFRDERIQVVDVPHGGIAQALNTGLRLARAPLVARFDADDICYPHRLQKQLDFMKQHPECTIAGSAADYIDQHGAHVFTFFPPACTDPEIQRIKKAMCPFIHSSVIFRTEAVRNAGGYHLHTHTFEDHFLWLKILACGKGYNMREPLLQVRLNPGSLTIDEKWRTREFHRIRNRVLENELITEEDGHTLDRIIRRQDNAKTKQGAYYSLLAKKYLWNNYQPIKARENIRKVLRFHPADWHSYLMWMLSWFPEPAVKTIYRISRNIH